MTDALIIGATGLTGRILLNQLLDNPHYRSVIAYTRRPIGIQHAKLDERVVDFEQINSAVKARDVYCCLGTTIKKAGSQDAFERVDYQYPLKIAQLQREYSKHFLIISAMGANAQSRIFYNRTKGKIEAALRALNYPSLTIFRPSMIMGERAERRVSERVFQKLLHIINPLLIGSLRPYQTVQASAIARAMQHYAAQMPSGQTVVPSDVIKGFE